MSNDKESFDSWFSDDDHDLYNFPEEAMKEAWDAGRAEQARRIEELEARALPLVREIPGSEEIKVGDLVTYADSDGVLCMREIQGPVIGHYAGGVSYCVYRPIK